MAMFRKRIEFQPPVGFRSQVIFLSQTDAKTLTYPRSHSKLSPFALQKLTFCKAKGKLLTRKR